MANFFNKLFKDETENTLIQLFRYGFVGGAAFLVDYGVLVLLTEVFGMHYLLSATISFILGLITNYLLSVVWVFNNRTLGNRWAEFAVFAIIGVIGLGLNALIMYVCTDKMGIHYMISKIISTVIVFFWNFFARKVILFKAKS
ncbi:MAG: GtrA family protein [Bacteroidales bacterium]|nr:GtrA family protein [Bacteroidales bacterium]